MNPTEIIENLIVKLSVPTGRHLYGVLGSYKELKKFEKHLKGVNTPDGQSFPKPINVNKGILDTIPDDEFRKLAENESKRPEPTAAYVAKAFEALLRLTIRKKQLLLLAHLELLFAYRIDLHLLRVLATDNKRIILLLPGKRSSGHVIVFPELAEAGYRLPTNLIADNHLWELIG
jgi:hypothetical protein